ncbi:MAG: hypothetical protein ACUVTW_11180 [Thermogutta sp.]
MVLVALAVVACYLWGGRAVRTLVAAGESPTSPAALSSMTAQGGSTDLAAAFSTAATVPASDGNAAVNSAAKIGSPMPLWMQFQDWISRRGADGEDTLVSLRDPFERPVSVAADAKADEESAQPVNSGEDEAIRPEDLGFRLRAVIIGPRGRSAVLGNTTVEEGSQITVNKNGRTIPVLVRKITREHASIAIGEKEYELRLPPAASIPTHGTASASTP